MCCLSAFNRFFITQDNFQFTIILFLNVSEWHRFTSSCRLNLSWLWKLMNVEVIWCCRTFFLLLSNIFLIIFILFWTNQFKAFNSNIKYTVSNLVLMFVCIIKFYYQSLYMSDITYPRYTCKRINTIKWINTIMLISCAYVT